MPQSEERRASSVLHYDLEKVLSCGLVKSHLEYHSQVGTSQLQKEGSREMWLPLGRTIGFFSAVAR